VPAGTARVMGRDVNQDAAGPSQITFELTVKLRPPLIEDGLVKPGLCAAGFSGEPSVART